MGTALAAPLLAKLDEQNGGFHIYGDSSDGNLAPVGRTSAALELAANITGLPRGVGLTGVKQCFDDWFAIHGDGKHEDSQIINNMGYKGIATPHGLRSLASSILNEKGFNPDATEMQLAHVEENKIRAAYNRTDYWSERVQFMQWYSDYLRHHYNEAKPSIRATTPARTMFAGVFIFPYKVA